MNAGAAPDGRAPGFYPVTVEVRVLSLPLGSLASRRCIRLLRGLSLVRFQGGSLTMNSKVCGGCGVAKSLDQFNKKGANKRQSRCRECQAKWYADYYASSSKERERLRQSTDKARRDLRDAISELKKGPCADCGRKFHPCAMDFDHVGGKKEFNISFAVASTFSTERVMKEIAKCDLVCACCHRVRTWQRRSGIF